MTEGREPRGGERIGLCTSCAHVEVVSSSKGSTFYLCHLSETDPSFRKYPVLPVVTCAGHQLKT
jgi:hypothetical protein